MLKEYQCTRCKELKLATEFSPRKGGKKPVHSWCKGCFRTYSNELNKKPLRQRVRRSYHLKYLYNVTPEKYADMYEQQKGVCAICERQETILDKQGIPQLLSVDHCHDSGNIRKLLCRSCNLAVGNVKDDWRIALRLSDYLKDFENLEKVKDGENRKTQKTSS